MIRTKATLIEKTKLDTDLYKTVLALPEGETVDFKPGQFMSIAVDGHIRRSYSLSNPPYKNTILETYADVSPHGPAYKFFGGAKVGDIVDVLVPLGSFTYTAGDVPAYFLGTGTGIVPFLSMIRQQLEFSNSERELYLYCGVKNENRLICADILTELQLGNNNFIYNPYISRPEGKTDYTLGRITAGVKHLTNPDAHYYICGGQSLIVDIEKQLLSNGIKPENIFYERYY